LALFEKLKEEHDITKVEKSDNAKVPVHLWDEEVVGRELTEREKEALTMMRLVWLRIYRKGLLRDVQAHLVSKFGGEWIELAKSGKGGQGLVTELMAMREILWRATENDWFEYPMGSRLLHFCFPARYQVQALEGIRVLFIADRLTSMWSQPPLGEEEKKVLQKKIKSFVVKSYIAPIEGKILSLINYFAVIKGIINNVVMDWHIVFHAGANKLNDCVWTPSFSLPTLNSLLRLVDEDTLMADRDMGEMFLNFQLHSKTVRFMGIDLGPLDFMPDECSHRWMCWQRNLMGFRGSPYNLVKMY
jgi:hypothetical protein